MEIAGSNLSLAKKGAPSPAVSAKAATLKPHFFRRAFMNAAIVALGLAAIASSCKKEEAAPYVPQPEPAVRFGGEVNDTIGVFPLSKTLSMGDTLFYPKGKFGIRFLGLKSKIHGNAIVSLLDSNARDIFAMGYPPGDSVYSATLIDPGSGRQVIAYGNSFLAWNFDTFITQSDSSEHMKVQITSMLKK